VADGSNDRPTLNRIGGGARQGHCSGRQFDALLAWLDF
jgi:hypothetical protein